MSGSRPAREISSERLEDDGRQPALVGLGHRAAPPAFAVGDHVRQGTWGAVPVSGQPIACRCTVIDCDRDQRHERQVAVAVLFPDAWDTRPAEAVEADGARWPARSRIEVVDLKYVDPDGMRSKRGAEPTADFSHLIPPLTPGQQAAFERVEVAPHARLALCHQQGGAAVRWVQSIGAGVSQLTSAGLADAGVRLDFRRRRQRRLHQRVCPCPAAAVLEAVAGNR